MDDGGGIGGVPCCIAVVINDIGGGVLLMLLFEQTTERDSIGCASGSCNDIGSLCNLHDDDDDDDDDMAMASYITEYIQYQLQYSCSRV